MPLDKKLIFTLGSPEIIEILTHQAMKTIQVTSEIEDLINQQVKTGKYQDDLAVIQEGLRLLAERERTYQGRFEDLKKEVMIGVEASNRGEVVDGETAMTQLKERLQQHRYVVRDLSILNGEPIIKGTRTPVRAIVETWRRGVLPEEIIQGMPHLTLAQVFDSLSYYSDHQEEINEYIEKNRIQLDLIDPLVKSYE